MRFFTHTLFILLGILLAYSPLALSETKPIDKNWLKTNLLQLAQPVVAKPYWYIQTSVLTRHFSPKPEHNNRQKLMGIERNTDESYLWGAAAFINSFEQRSIYGYVGKRFDFEGTPFYSKLTGGSFMVTEGNTVAKCPLINLKLAPLYCLPLVLNLRECKQKPF